jgi:hypothetical protein
MDSDGEVQEIDPPMLIHRGCKKYYRMIIREQIDVCFCRHCKRNKNNVVRSIDQDVVDATIATKASQSSVLDSVETVRIRDDASR